MRRAGLPCGVGGVGCLEGEAATGGLLDIGGNQEGDQGEGIWTNRAQMRPSGGLQCTAVRGLFPPLAEKSVASVMGV